MRKAETRQAPSAARLTFALVLGGLLALGVELMILLLGAVAVSKGILRVDSAPQITAAACLVGCLAGGGFACRRWQTRRLLVGLASGGVCFVLILAVALISGNDFEIGVQGLIELAACLVGGGLAGLLCGRGKKRRKRAR